MRIFWPNCRFESGSNYYSVSQRNNWRCISEEEIWYTQGYLKKIWGEDSKVQYVLGNELGWENEPRVKRSLREQWLLCKEIISIRHTLEQGLANSLAKGI